MLRLEKHRTKNEGTVDKVCLDRMRRSQDRGDTRETDEFYVDA